MASNSAIPVDQPHTPAEILQLQNQLAQVRNQRIILELRNEIARENQLLAAAQRRLQATESQTPTGGCALNSSHTPTPFTIGSTTPANKGTNATPWDSRPNPVTGNNNTSGTIIPRKEAELPRLPVPRKYYGRDRSSYLTLVSKLRGLFRKHKRYFALDKNKIAEAKRHLSRLVLDEWTTYTESRGRAHTWDEFRFFLLRQIERPATPRVARHRWNVTRQHRDETVRDFANYLVMLENDFSTPISEQDRSQRLCHGMNRLLQKRARDDTSFSTLRYDAQVELLTKWEMELARPVESVSHRTEVVS
ncbi:hypothetical protein BDV38DRAFT_199376 [Aspergillus pseudotamarii]|uniref:Retrotransposon gag domain-containing protein n=1 Tax=Aspergillus pseudotamarii TaxID=132259 RepID=A0A5N6SHL2_ASPPS|nr:uncharacterized protein BDV38DRAFT_199376 [Aspergillus pseudotamarii]KAE8132893.1 hypothetical protein BDV38DRAFT_199376 [Aspergillus pseudotamarii]